jgi:hypothetical protein
MAEPTQIKTDPDSVSENIELKTQEAPSVKGEQTQQNLQGLENTEGVNAFEPEPLKTDSFLNTLIENNENKASEQDTNQAEVDVEALQQLIAEGADPTQLLEETAAGEGEPTDGGGIYIPTIERTAAEVLADAGFDTTTTASVDVVVEEILINEPVVIKPPDNGVEINGIKAEGSDIVVDEDGLQGAVLDTSRLGETDSTESATAQNTFTVVAPDGVETVTIDGHTVISNGSLVAAPSFTTDLGNTFEIISYVSNRGVITYKYTLESSETHAGDDVEDSISETFEVVLVDTDGDSTTEDGIQSTETITVSIVDDIPSITSATATSDDLQVDETTLTTDDTVDLSGLFTAAPGADGEKPLVYSLSVASVGVDSGVDDTDTGQSVYLYMDNNDVVGRVGANGAANDTGAVAFRVSVDNSSGNEGKVTLDQVLSLKHPTTGSHDEKISLTANTISLKAVLTDGDDDTDTETLDLSGAISFKDDGPSVTEMTASTLLGAVVVTDETSHLGIAIVGTEFVFTGGTVDLGEDSGSSAVTLLINTAPTGFKTTVGDKDITLVADVADASIVYGKYDDTGTQDGTAFKISIGSDGKLTVTQAVAMVHPTSTDNDEAITLGDKLSAVVTATDGDDDVATKSVEIGAQISFKDDGPSAFYTTSSHLVDEKNNTHSVTNSLGFSDKSGADGVGTVEFNITVGEDAKDANGLALKLNGENLTLSYGETNNSTDKTILIAKTNAGDIGYQINLDTVNDSYTFTGNGMISNGTELNSISLSASTGGNSGYLALYNFDATTGDDLLISSSGSVNSGANWIGVGGGNSIDDNEKLRFDFVDNLKPTTTTSFSGFDYDNHNQLSQYRQSVSVPGGASGNKANITLWAIVADDDQDFIGDSTGESFVDLSISNISVFNSGTKVTGLTITDNVDNSITITGIEDGWDFQINSGAFFSAVRVDGASGTDTFKLGAISVVTQNISDPIDLSHNIVGIDGDGDQVSSTLDATLYPSAKSIEGTTGNDSTLNGTAGIDYIFGYVGDDTLTGLGSDDILLGGSGTDSLDGGDGHDILIGGAGDDTLTDGSGNDTFKWQAGETGTDTITDWGTGSDNDKLDLSELLQGEGSNATAVTLDNFLNFSYDTNTSDTTLTIDVDGPGSGTDQQIIVFEGVDLTQFGALVNDQSIITNLLTNNQLITD